MGKVTQVTALGAWVERAQLETAPTKWENSRCGFQPDHIGAWVERAQLETAPTKWENSRCGFQPHRFGVSH